MADKLTEQQLEALAPLFEYLYLGAYETRIVIDKDKYYREHLVDVVSDHTSTLYSKQWERYLITYDQITTAVSAQTDDVRWAYAHYRLQASIHITRIESSCGSVKVPIEGLFRVLQQDILTQLEALADALIGEE